MVCKYCILEMVGEVESFFEFEFCICQCGFWSVDEGGVQIIIDWDDKFFDWVFYVFVECIDCEELIMIEIVFQVCIEVFDFGVYEEWVILEVLVGIGVEEFCKCQFVELWVGN